MWYSKQNKTGLGKMKWYHDFRYTTSFRYRAYTIFVCKVGIWNINCAQATAFIFDSLTDAFVKVYKHFKTENGSIRCAVDPPAFRFMPNVLTIWNIGARHILSHVLEHWLGQNRYQNSVWLALLTGGFTSQMASDAESVSMSRGHYEAE